jgi:hypothetical protein
MRVERLILIPLIARTGRISKHGAAAGEDLRVRLAHEITLDPSCYGEVMGRHGADPVNRGVASLRVPGMLDTIALVLPLDQGNG